MNEATLEISLTVNGEQITKTVPVRQHLVDFESNIIYTSLSRLCHVDDDHHDTFCSALEE